MKTFLNSGISLLLGAITYFFVGRFASGDIPFIVAIWVAIVSAAGLTAFNWLQKNK